MSERFYIPNCLANWKWPRNLNPYYPEVKAASAAWARSFGAFSSKAQHAYDRCDFRSLFPLFGMLGTNDVYLDLLASLAYPLHDKGNALFDPRHSSPLTRRIDRLRTGCDLMNMFFVYDEYSDVAEPEEVQVMANIIMDALRNPHKPRPSGEWVGGEVTRQ